MSTNDSQMKAKRLLVAIASYGTRNLELLKQVIRRYQALPMTVEVVVLSEAPKSLGDNVKVVVGLPCSNPWSLPFGHKRLFAENLEKYDLFAYSEDDMEVTEANIRAFLHATTQLAPDEIAGFLRYEVTSSGDRWLPDVHAYYRWKPESVQRRGDHTVAEFTNEHAAFYLLNREQLRRAIASGGFLKEPYEGRHDMLCAAATDPYTSCGFRKVICVSALDDFLIHHLSNRYAGQVGLPLASFRQQIEILQDVQRGDHPRSTLCEVETKLLHGRASKSLYEEPCGELLSLVPQAAKTVLSVGCGWGAAEAKLKQRGGKVTALPLDSVIGAVAARAGIEVVYGTLNECFRSLAGRSFDAVLVPNLLHLQDSPGQVLEQCAQFVGKGGTLVLSGPNFGRLPTWGKRLLGANGHRRLRDFEESGVSTCGPGSLVKHLRKAGLRVEAVRWLNQELSWGKRNGRRVPLGRLTARDWCLQARR